MRDFFHTPSDRLGFLNVYLHEKYLCENLLNEMIQKGRDPVNNIITGKTSLQAFTSTDSEVKFLKATNPLAVFALEPVEPLMSLFNSWHSRSKQGLEIFPAVW